MVPAPVAALRYRFACPAASFANVTAAPSGDHTGFSSTAGSKVSRVKEFASGFATQMSELLPSLRENATRLPSGEIRGV